MDAPEKIYIRGKDAMLNIYSLYKEESSDIEYIRADAFIEKACEWLDNRGCLYIQYSEGGTSFNNKQFIGDFKKAMKGE